MVFMRVPVNAKGQIVIPKVFRTAFGIEPDTEVVLEERASMIVLRPSKSRGEIAAALEAFPKGRLGKINSDHDYAQELESRWTT